jgi:hypothetical protein
MLAVAVHVPVPGSYSSALVRKIEYDPPPWYPPVMSTNPLGSKVVAQNALAAVMRPVDENFPVAGSYRSWTLLGKYPSKPCGPPATSTAPLFNSVAVSDDLGARMLPVAVNVAVAGS